MPYITSTMQQDASNKLGMNAKKTMSVAQKLYEGIELSDETVGLITYMRTDSVRLSNDFISPTLQYIESKYDEINKVLENPFRRPNNRQVLRMDVSTTSVKIISKAIVSNYEYDWLQKPAPIVVSNLPAGFSINGVSTAQTSALDESLHRPIIKYAVQLAAASWASNNKS